MRPIVFRLASALLTCVSAFAQSPAQVDFFESKVRPILVSKCGSCHGDRVQMGGIRLTSKESLHVSGVVAPGDAEASRLVRAVRYAGTIKMPPAARLPQPEIDALAKWVAEGAIWPVSTQASAPTNPGGWAFQPVRKPEVPTVADAAWARSPIDRFILTKLEDKGLRPVRDADRSVLLRRVTIDLTGLLPTRAEMDSFLRDESPAAFERVVDRLLASPAFGDRWGRHWLDVTYWADTTGVGRRIPLREAWRYRDYVINAYNNDKPYDQFVREQIAGPSAEDGKVDPDAMAATGFLVIGPWAWFSYDKVQLRWDVADLQADLVGRTFLGLTVGCARCHDHKFDPIPNKDYYGLAGVFLSTKTLDSHNSNGGINLVKLPETTTQVKQYAADLEDWERRVAVVEEADKQNKKQQSEVKKRIEELKSASGNGESPELREAEEELARLKKQTGSAGDRQIAPFTRYMRPRLAEVYAAEDMEYPEDARIALRGDAHQLGDLAPRKVLSALTHGEPPVLNPQTSGREELAAWIADGKNPLTARVYVNRIWHHLFGDGIVATTENFGSRGEPATHPELLDYLAVRLVENGWSTKKTIREIVLSHVYQVASLPDSRAQEVDAGNKLLWRANRRRMEVEAIRDTILQVSGRLDPARGGPSLPLTAENVHTIAPFFLEEDSIIEDRIRYRRTVYQPVMRGGQMTDVDILNLFDFADPDQVIGTRLPTTVPTQTLYLMNSGFVKAESRRLAERLLKDPALDDQGRVATIISETLNREATERDQQQARQFLSDFQAGVGKLPAGPDPVVEGWARYCHAIFASSEFLYRR